VWYSFIRFFARILAVSICGYRLYGSQRLPMSGGVLLAANHQSFLDPVIFGLGLPRPVHFMARSSLFRRPLFGGLIRSLNAFPVRRGEVDHAAVREAIRLLGAGEMVLLFPEATRTRDGSIAPPRGGLSMIAARAGVPIVPIVVDGAFRAWPRHRRLPRPAVIRVAVGEPIPPAELAGLSDHEAASMLHSRLKELQSDLTSSGTDP
jgi:1-acyl-sn-glycerol-3-phosphate acyltransferase